MTDKLKGYWAVSIHSCNIISLKLAYYLPFLYILNTREIPVNDIAHYLIEWSSAHYSYDTTCVVII